MINTFFLQQKLIEIDEILKNRYTEVSEVGVISGISGMALFQFYYAEYLNKNEHAETGSEMLFYSINKVNAEYVDLSYCNGIAGLCWTIQHLIATNFLDVDADRFLSVYDEQFYVQMKSDLEQHNFDFLHGALGYGLYFLSRYKNTSDVNLKKQYEGYLLELVYKLKSFAIFDETHFKWESVINVKTGATGFDLGLSHGISSIVNFLSRLLQFEVFKKPVKKLMKGSVAFLLSTENDENVNRSLFPSLIQKERPLEYNSRMSWCYGDLGIGLSLLKASKALKDSVLQKKAYNIFVHTAKRRTVQETLVRDAGICHGSYGNALIYGNIAHKIKGDLFKSACAFWMKNGIEKAVHKDGYAGYKQWCNTQKEWVGELSLLEGIAGIGLTIISYLSKKRNKWDECLLIS